MLLVGFSAGQVQLIDPIKKELSKLYNEERLIDKTKVTCIKWIPGSANQFLVSHASGHLYVYNEASPCGPNPPSYQMFKQGEGYSVLTCRTRTACNPAYRWVIGEGPINEFAFSPDNKHLAVVSQDGYLRVFDFDSMELVGVMKSYFGGLLCCSWSPDGKYVATGGEDDLLSVFSLHERRVVCRGQGHNSWVNVVAFDPYTCQLEGSGNGSYIDDDDDADVTIDGGAGLNQDPHSSNSADLQQQQQHRHHHQSSSSSRTQQQQRNGDIVGCACETDGDSSSSSLPKSRFNNFSNARSTTTTSTMNGGGNYSLDDCHSPGVNHVRKKDIFSGGKNSSVGFEDGNAALNDVSYDCDTTKEGGGGGGCGHSGVGRGIGANSPTPPCVSYRIGSIGQDTLMCLWDLTEDLLRPQNVSRTRANTSVSMSYNCVSPPSTATLVNGNPASSSAVLTNGPVDGNDPPNGPATPRLNDHGGGNGGGGGKSALGSHSVVPSQNNVVSPSGTTGAIKKGGDHAIGNHVNPASSSEANPGLTSASSSNHEAGSAAAAATAPPPVQQQPQQHRLSSTSLTQKLSSLTLGHHHSKEKGGGDKKSASDSKEGKASKGGGSGDVGGGGETHHSSDFNVFGFHGKKKDKGSGGASRHLGNNHASQSSIAGSGAGATSGAASVTSTKSGGGGVNGGPSAQTMSMASESIKVLGTPSCPRFEELSILEPLICKKIAHERLTALCFREDCLVTACQEGFVCTWARPGKVGFGVQQQTQQQPPPPCQSPQLPAHHHQHQEQQQPTSSSSPPPPQQPVSQSAAQPSTVNPHSMGNMSSASHLPHHHHSTHHDHSLYNRLNRL